jgi:hypothetical protein
MATIIKIVYDVTNPVIKVTYDVTNITIAGNDIAPVYISLDYSSSSAVTVITSVGLTMPTGFSVANSPLTQSGTLAVTYAAGYSLPTTTKQSEWDQAYNDKINSASVTGTSTKTLTLNQQDGGTITTTWSDIDTGLTSVGLSMPSAFSVSNSPLTANGTISVTGSGTTAQYVRGDGSLATFPALTGYVPYTGATTNVDLGEYSISSGQVILDTLPTSTQVVGGTIWNNTLGTSETLLKGGSVVLKNGVDLVARVINKVTPNTTLTKAAYQAVRVSGAQGQRLAVAYAQANNDNNSADTIGLVAETIATNQEGFIITVGQLEEINTSGSLQGETWADGDVLYLSPTTPGAITNVKPVAPQHLVIIGYVEYAHANHGKIYVKVMNGWELGELHDVNTSGAVNGNVLKYNGSIWVPSSDVDTGITSLNGLTPLSQNLVTGTSGSDFNISSVTSTHTFNLPVASATNSGKLSNTDWSTFNSKENALTFSAPLARVTNTISIPVATASASGYLSSTDWNTFNNKVGSVSASSPLASSGGVSPTLSIQQANGSQGGYLTSTDWNTFNGKQNALSGSGIVKSTSGTISYLTDNSSNWNSAYDNMIVSASVTGTTTKTLTLTQQDAGTITATWTDYDTAPVTSVFGRTGAVVAQSGDYTTTQVTEGTNLYYTEGRVSANTDVAANTAARHNAVTIGTANGLSLSTQALSLGLSSSSTNGALSSTDWSTFNAKQNAITLTTTGSSGSATLVGSTLNIPSYSVAGLGAVPDSRTITINGVVYDLSANRNFEVGDYGTF